MFKLVSIRTHLIISMLQLVKFMKDISLIKFSLIRLLITDYEQMMKGKLDNNIIGMGLNIYSLMLLLLLFLLLLLLLLCLFLLLLLLLLLLCVCVCVCVQLVKIG